MDKNGWYCILTKGGALSSYVESLAESAATYIPFAESSILWDTYLVFTLGSAIKNMGLFSKIPIDFKIETRDF